jgi:hypothetical protein
MIKNRRKRCKNEAIINAAIKTPKASWKIERFVRLSSDLSSDADGLIAQELTNN